MPNADVTLLFGTNQTYIESHLNNLYSSSEILRSVFQTKTHNGNKEIYYNQSLHLHGQ